jgi:hypothetical protein
MMSVRYASGSSPCSLQLATSEKRLAAAWAWSSLPQNSQFFLPVAIGLIARSESLCDAWRYPWDHKVKVLKR